MHIICDIDGTVADLSQRLHHIKAADGTPVLKPNWDAFFDDCFDDEPIDKVFEIVRALKVAGHSIIFLSGRSDRVRGLTNRWLMTHSHLKGYWLFMRKHGDHRPDNQVKAELLDLAQQQLEFSDAEILCVLDDRRQVVDMWRERGLLCLQTVEGNY